MPYITTYTGKHFDPTQPDINLMDIRDIAHSLSLTCRGNGHVNRFFSVGQHCLNCAKEALKRGYSARIAMALLIHDGSEAYMSDVPRPFKQTLEGYKRAEEYMLSLVYRKFLGSDPTPEEQAIIKEIDDDMLYFDLRELLGEDMGCDEPKVHIPICYDFIPFDEVEREFLALYDELNAKL